MTDNSTRVVISVNPFRCKMWPLHDRMDFSISEINCRMEIESFEKHGQLVPVLGRTLRGDPEHEVELIYGARRLFVAQHLNRGLLVELRELNDKQAVIAMDIENRQRRDVSPYERGRHYLCCMRSGLFKSQDELARELGVSASQISRHLKFTRLPSAVISAFYSPVDICEAWGIELADAIEDPGRRARVLEKARSFSHMESRPAAAQIYEQLIAATAPGRKIRSKQRDEVVRDGVGSPLFRIRHYQDAIALILPKRTLSAESMERIRKALTRALRPETSHSLNEITAHASTASLCGERA